jgi:hypothetical protein
MTAPAITYVRAGCLDGSDAGRKGGPCSRIVRAYDKRGTKTMGGHALRVLCKHPLDVERWIPPLRKHQLEDGFAPRE